jgi:hypothetical protein
MKILLPAVVLTAALAACAPDSDTSRLTAPDAPSLSATYGATLVECPASETLTATASVGPTGGEVRVGAHRMVVPPLAVVGPAKTFTLTVPASNYMEVQIRAGNQQHFQFNRPVSVTLDYSRCTRSNIEKGDLRVLYVDPVTKQILQDMGGVDDKDARTVTIDTDHLSGYAIGQG